MIPSSNIVRYTHVCDRRASRQDKMKDPDRDAGNIEEYLLVKFAVAAKRKKSIYDSGSKRNYQHGTVELSGADRR